MHETQASRTRTEFRMQVQAAVLRHIVGSAITLVCCTMLKTKCDAGRDLVLIDAGAEYKLCR